MKRRVVVTGMGLVSCFGTDVEEFYQKLLAGTSGVIPIETFPCKDWPTSIGAPVQNFDSGDYIDKKQARRVDPFIRYGMVAGKKALEHAGLYNQGFTGNIDLTRAGIVIGSGMGGMSVFAEGAETLFTKGYKRLSPFFVPYIITNMAGALLAIDLGFQGPNFSISTACATANYSIQAAGDLIFEGKADLMLCGGTEAAIHPLGLAGFVSIRALSTRNDEPTKASRPWDIHRDGFVMGEGAGVLVLEELNHALARNAPIYAEYLGGAVNCDAHHMTDPKPNGEGVALCMKEALRRAGVPITHVDHINAHATSTLAGDLCEIAAIRTVFGPHACNIKINGTKSMIGHCLGAAGGLEAIAVVKAIEEHKVHPTMNCDDPEPATEGLNLVRDHAQNCNIRVALSNSFGFGGHNSTLVFSSYKRNG